METKITRLPPAGRGEQLRRHGLDPSPRWSGVEGVGHAACDGAEAEFLRDGGWSVVTLTEGGGRDGGMTSHRGALHPEEYVDHERLVGLVEGELGFSLDELRSVYSTGGRIADHLRGLRGLIDARLLALSRAGANMDLFSRITGVSPAVVDRALARARKATA